MNNRVKRSVLIYGDPSGDLLRVLTPVRPKLRLNGFRPLTMGRSLIILTIRRYGITVQRSVTRVTTTMRNTAIQLPLGDTIFLNVITGMTRECATTVGTGLAHLPFNGLITELVRGPSLHA